MQGFVMSPTASEYMRVPSAGSTYTQLGLYGVDMMVAGLRIVRMLTLLPIHIPNENCALPAPRDRREISQLPFKLQR